MSNPFEPVLLIEERGPVRVVTMNLPDSLNANRPDLHDALVAVWKHLAADPAARAVVLTGAGRAFSAGGDMNDFVLLWDDTVRRARELDQARQLVLEMLDFPLPVVAAVNGPAVGLGASLAFGCDLVVIAEGAYLADPHVAIGLTAGDGGAATWPFFMSMPRVKEYLFTGDRLTADVALQLGIANRVVAKEACLDEAVALATRLAQMPPQALRTTKRAVNIHLRRAIEGILDYALEAEYHSFDTPEHQAAVNGFLAR
ncbi:MAG TPA: enoyl-CoA hydratase/isomerase family protein [Mycobacteriales bacterium]|nr:enoyl-CoA hydratase/isomerase family protein [Mycobacteriales bacterium]